MGHRAFTHIIKFYLALGELTIFLVIVKYNKSDICLLLPASGPNKPDVVINQLGWSESLDNNTHKFEKEALLNNAKRIVKNWTKGFR
jgi:hypothetical protein